ncbi:MULTISPECIES: hypothetical protein [Burkholderia]|uniref:hypothetical protein n=3 Tax=Bacteria TaxID=2 RepID=UPI001589393A|nr:hypothetical protein [Burkholderia ambifaria]
MFDGGYITSPVLSPPLGAGGNGNSSANLPSGKAPRSLIDYTPEEAEDFAIQAQRVVALYRAEAAGGRVYSASGLIPLSAFIAYKGLIGSATKTIAALTAGGAAVYATRNYLLAPRYERIYTRAEAAIQCARSEYAVAEMAIGARHVPDDVHDAVEQAFTAADSELMKLDSMAKKAKVSIQPLRDQLTKARRDKWAADAYLEGGLRAHKAALFKAVHLIIAQANEQIAEDQPTIADDKALFGSAFTLPTSLRTPSATQTLALPSDTKYALDTDTQKTALQTQWNAAAQAIKTANDKVVLYVQAAQQFPPPQSIAGATNYGGCAYQQLTGVRPALTQPLTLGAADADSNQTFPVTTSTPVSVAISGGTPSSYAVAIADPPTAAGAIAPSAKIELRSGIAFVVVTVGSSTPKDRAFKVVVTDGTGTLKQFYVQPK